MGVLSRVPGIGGWNEDPAWAHFYDWSVEHPRVGGLGWRLGMGSDLRLLYAAIAELGALPSGSAVLDVPCGGGVALRGVRPGQGLRYVAADISTAMLERTREAAEERGVAAQVEYVEADVAAMPFPDAEFDAVVTFTGLHCFPDPRAACRDIARVVHPGGTLTGSAVFNDTGWRYEGVRVVGRLGQVLGPGCTRDELTGWLEEDGFTDVRIRTSGAIAYFRAVRR